MRKKRNEVKPIKNKYKEVPLNKKGTVHIVTWVTSVRSGDSNTKTKDSKGKDRKGKPCDLKTNFGAKKKSLSHMIPFIKDTNLYSCRTTDHPTIILKR